MGLFDFDNNKMDKECKDCYSLTNNGTLLKAFMFNRLKRYNTLLLTYEDDSYDFIYQIDKDIYLGNCLPYSIDVGMYDKEESSLGLIGGITNMTADQLKYFLSPPRNHTNELREENDDEVVIKCLFLSIFRFIYRVTNFSFPTSDEHLCSTNVLTFSDDILCLVEDDTFHIIRESMGTKIGNLKDRWIDYSFDEIKSIDALFIPTELYLPSDWVEILEGNGDDQTK